MQSGARGVSFSDSDDVTVDAIGRGELELVQPRRGYRLNVDALMLASFAESCVGGHPDVVVDLGAGCGVIGLALARRWPRSRAILVELQSELVALAQHNVEHNGLVDRVTVCSGDLRDPCLWAQSGSREVLAVCNPPFFVVGRGRASPDRMLAQARHEVSCTLVELVRACAQGLRCGDRLALIHMAQRRDELLDVLTEHGLLARRVRSVLPLPRRQPHRVMVLAERQSTRNTPKRRFQPREDVPLVVHERPGVYSRELRRMLKE